MAAPTMPRGPATPAWRGGDPIAWTPTAERASLRLAASRRPTASSGYRRPASIRLARRASGGRRTRSQAPWRKHCVVGSKGPPRAACRDARRSTSTRRDALRRRAVCRGGDPWTSIRYDAPRCQAVWRGARPPDPASAPPPGARSSPRRARRGGVVAAADGAFGSGLPCSARRARDVGALGGTFGSTGLVTLRVIRAIVVTPCCRSPRPSARTRPPSSPFPSPAPPSRRRPASPRTRARPA